MFWRKQRNCYHINAHGIYGDAINFFNGKRGICINCNMLLDELPLRERSKNPPGDPTIQYYVPNKDGLQKVRMQNDCNKEQKS